MQRLTLLIKDDDDRFWVLPMVQTYAGAELLKEDFREELTERWLGWLVEFAQKYGVDLDLHVERAQIVGAEYLNLLSAIRWSHEHELWTTLVQLVEGIWFYPYLIGLFGDFRETLEAAVQSARRLQDERNEGRFLCRLGRLY